MVDFSKEIVIVAVLNYLKLILAVFVTAVFKKKSIEILFKIVIEQL